MRGLVARLFWAWAHDEVPKGTIIWLIDRNAIVLPNYHKYYSKLRNQPRRHKLRFMDEKDTLIECFPWRIDNEKVPRSSLTFANRLLRWHGYYLSSIIGTRNRNWPGRNQKCIRTFAAMVP